VVEESRRTSNSDPTNAKWYPCDPIAGCERHAKYASNSIHKEKRAMAEDYLF